jgi:hypothetical protein
LKKHLHHPKYNLTQGKAVKLQAMTMHSAAKIYGTRFPKDLECDVIEHDRLLPTIGGTYHLHLHARKGPLLLR